MVGQEPAQPQAPQAQQTVDVGQADKLLGQMKAGVDKAIKDSKGNQRARAILEHIDKSIEQLATMVDDAAASDFIKHFLDFAAKFYQYSFGNQMLIWFQKPDAKLVRGHKQWLEFGRQVTNWENAIHIIRPNFRKHKITDDERSSLDPASLKKLEDKKYMNFAGATVFDISDTTPIPGWKGKQGQDPFEYVDYRQDRLEKPPEEQVEMMGTLIDSAIDLGAELKIDIASEEMEERMSGYSANKKIRLNQMLADGTEKFSTLVHELAHELLHWGEKSKKWGKKAVEIDAESTAWIVLKHYGFTSKDSANYIALFRGTGRDVKERREYIQKAAKQIIEGINNHAENRMNPEEAA